MLIVAETCANELLLVRQYKHAAEQFMIEFPAGYVESNERADETCSRKLLEETGYQAEHYSFLGKLTNNPSKEKGDLYAYMAHECELVAEPRFDELEDIEVICVDVSELEQMIERKQIWTAGTIAAMYMYMRQRHTN